MISGARELARRLVFRRTEGTVIHSSWARKLASPARPAIRRAFTLIELLTVMAISAILMGLIIVPLVQSFNMTRTAQAFADAQDRARILTERISLEIGNAVGVRSTSGLTRAMVNGVSEKVPQHSMIVQVPGADGALVDIALPYSKVDIIKPAEGDPASIRDGAYIDPNTGLADPTLTAPKGQVMLPVAPGATIVRYSIGLRNPFANYNNPYDGLLMVRNAQQDNLYVLYRSEVNPLETETTGAGERLKYFLEELDGSGQPDLSRPIYDDPGFFTPNRDGSGNIIRNDDRARIIGNWLGIDPVTGASTGTRRAIIQTEVSRYDMIQSVFNLGTREVSYDGNIPRIVSLVQFAPEQMSSDPAEGQVAARQGEETENAAAIAPDVYVTKYGLWDRALIRNWPKGWNPGDVNRNVYNVARGDITSGDGTGFPTGVSIYAYDPDDSPVDFEGGLEVFDISAYEGIVSRAARYPFSQALRGGLSSPKARDAFVPFTYRAGTGKIVTSFSIAEVGDASVNIGAVPNLPTLATSGPGGPMTPQTDSDTGGQFWEARHKPINEKFNKVWADQPGLQPGVHRFIDLRVAEAVDGSFGPLHPNNGFQRAMIVPGSEEVYGPDQLPGPNLGRTVRYTRSTREPGPNQYKINYVDKQEPNNGVRDPITDEFQVDYSVYGFANPPATYDERNFVSAVIQPRFKKGYLQLNSSPTDALPQGDILVSYRFQFNGAAGRARVGSQEDVFAVDYDTRQLINVLLTIRNYPQSTLPNPQGVTLKSTATVRNYIR